MRFNETFFGLLLHSQLKKSQTFQYAEERSDYKAPEKFMPGYKTRMAQQNQRSSNAAPTTPSFARTQSADDEYSTPMSEVSSQVGGIVPGATANNSDDQPDSNDLEKPPTLDSKDDPYLVDWYGDDDPDNPFNWSAFKKCFFLFQIMILTTAVYMGSSIVSPALPLMAEYWNVGLTPAALSLTLFVFGYGLGPMLGICAASEIPVIGRAIPYVISLFIFVVLQVPTAVVHGIAGFMILRFLAGLVGSPPLATGGASVQDVFTPMAAPLAMGLWGISASAGPVLGPLIGGFTSQHFMKTSLGTGAWRWTIWPLLMATGVTLLILTFFMPETSSTNILLRRAKRIRAATGNPHLRSRGELIGEQMTGKEIALMTFVRPFRLGLGEPIALSINLHIGLVYGILYSFFESFPIVFNETYGFNMGEAGLAFVGILVANLLSYMAFAWWFLSYYRPKLVAAKGKLAPELWLHPAMVGGICLPISLFFFGWTATASIHWIVPIIGTMVFSPGIFGLFTSGLNYLAITYPDYVASTFSANDFMRASIGAAMPLVSRQMFTNLNRGPTQFPVAWGCTLLGGLAVLMAPIPYLLYFYGPALRRVSPYATDPTASNDDDDGEKAV
jgi:DHA1 family multidrug resistance protein-like MFS transporter